MRLNLFETFKQDFEKHKKEEQEEATRVSDLFKQKSKELTDSYIRLINEAGQELIDDWTVDIMFDSNRFLFRIELNDVSDKDIDQFIVSTNRFESKLEDEFQIEYRLLVSGDFTYDETLLYRNSAPFNTREGIEQGIRRILKNARINKNSTVIHIWLS